MNTTLLSFILTALIAHSAAAPVALKHGHHQHQKRDPVVVTQTIVVQATQEVVPNAAVQADVNTADLVGNADVENAQTTEAAAAAETTSDAATDAETTPETAAPVAVKDANQEKSTNNNNNSSGSSSGSFQDGTISCSDFPSSYGAVSVDWVGLNGWASIMSLDGSTSTNCEDGFYCSYACPAGQSKTQWPSNQPGDGRSVGGLYCKGGYLYRSNTAAGSLCESDVGSGFAKSNLSQDVALCRTDYPGSENMVIPTLLKAGGSASLSVVNEDTYFVWQGLKTSTQYYVNNAGVSVEDGCVWGSSGSGVGNWAPLVVGAGYINGLSYLSLIPNPNNNSPANFNVKIEATSGSSINGDCYYENGSFASAGGCTVTVTSGSAQLVFY